MRNPFKRRDSKENQREDDSVDASVVDAATTQEAVWLSVGRLGPFSVAENIEPGSLFVIECFPLREEKRHLMRFDPPGGLVFAPHNQTKIGFVNFFILQGQVDPSNLPEVSCRTIETRDESYVAAPNNGKTSGKKRRSTQKNYLDSTINPYRNARIRPTEGTFNSSQLAFIVLILSAGAYYVHTVYILPRLRARQKLQTKTADGSYLVKGYSSSGKNQHYPRGGKKTKNQKGVSAPKKAVRKKQQQEPSTTKSSTSVVETSAATVANVSTMRQLNSEESPLLPESNSQNEEDQALETSKIDTNSSSSSSLEHQGPEPLALTRSDDTSTNETSTSIVTPTKDDGASGIVSVDTPSEPSDYEKIERTTDKPIAIPENNGEEMFDLAKDSSLDNEMSKKEKNVEKATEVDNAAAELSSPKDFDDSAPTTLAANGVLPNEPKEDEQPIEEISAKANMSSLANNEPTNEPPKDDDKAIVRDYVTEDLSSSADSDPPKEPKGDEKSTKSDDETAESSSSDDCGSSDVIATNPTSAKFPQQIYFGNLHSGYDTDDIKAIFDKPVIPSFFPITVDHIVWKPNHCFVYLKDDDISESERRNATRYIEAIHGKNIEKVSAALNAEPVRGGGLTKRKEEHRRKNVKPSHTLFVANIHTGRTPKAALEQLFASYGTVLGIQLVSRRGCAWVQFATVEESTRAKEELHGYKLQESVLSVQFAEKDKLKSKFTKKKVASKTVETSTNKEPAPKESRNEKESASVAQAEQAQMQEQTAIQPPPGLLLPLTIEKGPDLKPTFNTAPSSLASSSTTNPQKPKNVIILLIEGMTCGGCVKVVNRVLSSFDEVDSVVTDLKTCTSTLSCNVQRVNLLPILTALDDVGMQAYLQSQGVVSPAPLEKSENDSMAKETSALLGSTITTSTVITESSLITTPWISEEQQQQIKQQSLGAIGRPLVANNSVPKSPTNPLSLMDELREGSRPLRRYQCSCGCEGCICSASQVHANDHGTDIDLTELCNRIETRLGTTDLEEIIRETGGSPELRDKIGQLTFPCGCSDKD